MGESQAPPDLEVIEVQPQLNFEDMGPMGGTGYEPSADELIDVLKNLENLAAANPGLYRTIVEQIQGSSSHYEEVTTSQQTTSVTEQQEMHYQQQQEMQYQQHEEEQMYQQQLEQQQYELQMQQQMQYEEHSSMTQQVIEEATMSEESAMLQQQQQIELERQQRQQQQEMEMQKAKMSMNEEEFKQHQKMKRLEAEAQEEVRQALTKQREAKPKQPVEIAVIAGDGKQVRIQLGGDTQEDSRKQVAEAAGLKHVPLPDFEDNNAAWAGSLKKTPKSKMMSGRGEEEMDGENPWSGSLRHVKGPAKNKKHDEKEDMHGGAPWMGTLRHVVHDNKVVKNYGVNQQQSKRYPDEDAGNPYESLGGSQSKPAFPLTPAAIINGAMVSRDDMARMEEEEEVARIRSNIGSKTVSTALLQVLMPKLLKMHESKYEPMEKTDAEKIMEEILSMQAGLNPDQQADANEEAEMIIRAIMQDEVDNSVYSKMADDLEAASKRVEKRKVKKVKENTSEISA